jgi:hypothetical protein
MLAIGSTNDNLTSATDVTTEANLNGVQKLLHTITKQTNLIRKRLKAERRKTVGADLLLA